MTETEGRFPSQTSASCLRDTRFTVGVSCVCKGKCVLSCCSVLYTYNLMLMIFYPCPSGRETSPALLVPSGKTAKRNSCLEQPPISERLPDRLNTANIVTNSQTPMTHKRRPGKNCPMALIFTLNYSHKLQINKYKKDNFTDFT